MNRAVYDKIDRLIEESMEKSASNKSGTSDYAKYGLGIALGAMIFGGQTERGREIAEEIKRRSLEQHNET